MFGGINMLILITSVVVFVSAQAPPDSTQTNYSPSAIIKIDKCCPLDERLSYNRRECKVPKTEPKIASDNTWLVGMLLPVDALPIVHYDPATTIRHTCQPKDIDFIILTEDSNYSLLEDGSLHLTQEITLPVGSFCIDRMLDDTIVILTCPCSSFVCVQKCCHPPLVLHISNVDGDASNAKCRMPPLQSIIWSQQIWTYQRESNRPLYEVHGNPECDAKAAQYIVDKRGKGISELHVTNDGGLQLANFGYFAPRTFCADIAITDSGVVDFGVYPVSGSLNDSGIYSGSISLNVITCRLRLSPTTRQHIYGVLYIIGTASLILTVLVHLLFPQLRKTAQAYIMIAYCTSLALAYMSHSVIIFAGVKIQGTIYCRILGLTIQGGFLAAFLWLNVICIDIAATFRGLHLSKNSGKIQKGKKFAACCFYVYGITALFIGLTMITQHILSENSSPIFANENCWFNDVTTATIFFFLPLGLSQLINIVLFISTALKIYKAQRQTAILSRDGSGRHTGKKPYSNQDKRRCYLFVKLFFLMGLTWTFEVISATFDEKNKLWYITDTINMLSGVIIFAMFCCKRKVIKLFLDTIKCKRETETNSSQKATVSPKLSNSYSTRSTSIHVFNIDSAYRNEISMTSSPNL
ncbi:hypothetical protein LSTR_LSTR004203 [Laodelphax striatellus]|uniref:G-protein coupled receptors family 2 profile 2 domain-containing protein n=1 Tax=Laodelphax striatellus TaxID=195883 RepID=A0A482X8U5_LAOST|nr:hypothetical protein LSTR_LSTR004203 [Laodelphax striatellus]